MGSCCKHLAVRSFALEVRCSCKPLPKQMLSPVLTSKGKVLRLNFHPEVQDLAKRRVSLRGLVTLPGTLPSALSLSPLASTQALLERQISAASVL